MRRQSSTSASAVGDIAAEMRAECRAAFNGDIDSLAEAVFIALALDWLGYPANLVLGYSKLPTEDSLELSAWVTFEGDIVSDCKSITYVYEPFVQFPNDCANSRHPVGPVTHAPHHAIGTPLA